MALLVCHVTKFKSEDLKGIEIHNDRKSLHSKNKDIDYSRTSTNFDALTGIEGNPNTNYPKVANAITQAKYTGTRAIRKDAVRAVGVLVTAGHQFFEGMSNEKQKVFFSAAAEYLAEKFGKDNIIAAKVHRDEATPHMHFSFVPIRDGKLTAKTIIDRKALKELQDELPKVLQAKGFAIERGVVESENEHTDTNDYKRSMALAKQDVSSVIRTTDRIAAENQPERAGVFDSTQVVKLPVDDYNYLMAVAKDYAAVRVANADLEAKQSKNVPKLRQENEKLKEAVKLLEETITEKDSQLAEARQKTRYLSTLKEYAPKELDYAGDVAAKRMREAKQNSRQTVRIANRTKSRETSFER